MDLTERSVIVVAYDISNPKRLTKVRKTLLGFGEPIQLSVFRCELLPKEQLELRAALQEEIHDGEDQVLFVDLGPADGRGAKAIEAIGRSIAEVNHRAVVV
jgi:CRISPR-associated protein Cas2